MLAWAQNNFWQNYLDKIMKEKIIKVKRYNSIWGSRNPWSSSCRDSTLENQGYLLSQTSAIGAVGMGYRSGWIFGLTHYYFLYSYVKYFEPKNEKYSDKETAIYWESHLSYKLDLNYNPSLPHKRFSVAGFGDPIARRIGGTPNY